MCIDHKLYDEMCYYFSYFYLEVAQDISVQGVAPFNQTHFTLLAGHCVLLSNWVERYRYTLPKLAIRLDGCNIGFKEFGMTSK